MPVLDTAVLIRLAGGDATAARAVQTLRAQGLLVPAHAAMEFLSGVDDPVAELAWLQRHFQVIHPTDRTILEGARMRRQLREQGLRRPGWGDIHIAAEAALAGTLVVSSDKAMARLDVPVWDPWSEPEPPA